MRSLLTLLLLLNTYCMYSQTYYYDEHRQIMRRPKGHAYKRVITQKGQDDYILTDYYANGSKYMEGRYLTSHPEYLADYRSTIFRQDSFTYYYDNGAVMRKGYFQNGARHGVWKTFYKNGKIECEKTYKHALKNGTWKWYFDNGMTETTCEYADGKQTGTQIVYNREGQKLSEEVYADDSLISTKYFNGAHAEDSVAEIMPEPGYDVYKFLARHIKYPKEARAQHLTGRVKISFVLDTDGYITDVETTTPFEYQGFILEAIKVVSRFPRWQPGMQDGERVKVYYTLPITFRASDDK